MALPFLGNTYLWYVWIKGHGMYKLLSNISKEAGNRVQVYKVKGN